MAITIAHLQGIASLDDLIGFVAALGYAPAGHELNETARERLGLTAAVGARAAAIVGRHGPFRVYGVHLEQATRARVASVVECIAKAAPGEQQLVLALEPRRTLAVAALAPCAGRLVSRQLRVALEAPSHALAEILNGLAPRTDESALALAGRLADVLAEEGLTRRFFRELSRLHARASEQVVGMARATEAERREFALVVITRVLFLYFVQAKGWLAGRSDFLPSAFDTALGRGHPFHQSVFEPLCFGALSTPARSRTGRARRFGDIPFLNGGLFERHGIERRYAGAHLTNETWRDLFDELFRRFHFTVAEGSDHAAVDPEMLGRVFEGLMGADRRKTSGTYFTPPDLLRSTVAAALDAALANRAPDDVRHLRVLDPAVGSGAFLLEALGQLEQRRATLWPDEPRAAHRRAVIRDNLFGVDIDPMAVRLAELRLWLALVADDTTAPAEVAPLPNLDQNLRQGDSLLSPLDLARAASPTVWSPRLAQVAERRSLYFAAAGRDKAALARQIRQDERAIAVETTDAAIAALTSRLADVAGAHAPDLFGVTSRRARAERERIALWRRERRELVAVRRRIAADEALPFFSFDVHFGEILAGGGFDVVVGNPPWVRGERLPASARIALARHYASFRAATARQRSFAHLPDLAVPFVERALRLVAPEGVVALTVPSKLLRAGYAGPLRALVRREATVVSLDDRAHGGRSGFDATVFPSVWVLRRSPPSPDAPARVRVATASGRALEGRTRQCDLSLLEGPSAPWLAWPASTVASLRRAMRAGPALASFLRPCLGVKTGANEVFVRSADRAAELPESCRAAAVLGRDVAPFGIAPSCVALLAVDTLGRPLRAVPQDVVTYLRAFSAILERRADARGAPRWAVFRTDLLAGRWIVVWRDIASRLEAALLTRAGPSDPAPLNTCYGVVAPDLHTAHWLTAYLNSGPARAIAAVLAERASGGCYRFSATTVGALPLPPDPTAPPVRALARFGARATESGEWDSHDLDALAARALDLDAATAGALRDLGDALRRNTDADH